MRTGGLYPEIEPYGFGMLEVDDGGSIYWEACGNPTGKPAVVLHGGPGSGCTRWHRRAFDPDAYRIVLFDQRNCGRSKPHASEPHCDLSTNTTHALVSDIESLRNHLGIDRWLVWGGSWGSTLALVYAVAHVERVSEMILWGVTTGRHSEFDWVFRGGLSRFFPEQWEKLRAALQASGRGRGDIVQGYRELLYDPDPGVRRRAAEAWCRWESATIDWHPTDGLTDRFRDPAYALAFARIVTHYVSNNAWLEDGVLLRDARVLANVPAVMVNGRLDFQAPIGNAWALKGAWPEAELVVVNDTGHDPTGAVTTELIRASDRFALTDDSITDMGDER